MDFSDCPDCWPLEQANRAPVLGQCQELKRLAYLFLGLGEQTCAPIYIYIFLSEFETCPIGGTTRPGDLWILQVRNSHQNRHLIIHKEREREGVGGRTVGRVQPWVLAFSLSHFDTEAVDGELWGRVPRVEIILVCLPASIT